jgi:o-succinylbenzoate---CoA ligase
VTRRPLEPLAVPTGPDLLRLLPRLASALAGDGPALLLHQAEQAPDPAFGPDEPLDDGEDDDADPTAFVLATSGSSGRPKGTLLPAAALLASASATNDRLGGPGRWLDALPGHYVAGLQVLVRSLVSRAEPVVLDVGGGFDPAAFTAAADRLTGPRRYTALVPTQVVRLLDAGPAATDALASFEAVLVGGAGIPLPLRERVQAAGIAMVGSYGMSETCGGCVYDGVPLDGVQVRVEPDPRPGRPTGHPRPDQQGPARIWLGGPVLARGYRRDPRATAAAFRTGPDGLRLFGTGDAGRWRDGRLQLAGRLDALINTGGLKVDPVAVEESLLRLPGVAEVAVLGVDDPVWGQRVVAAVVPSRAGPVPDLPVARTRVAAEVAPHAAPRQLLVLDAIPLRGTGKPDRTRLAELAQLARRAEPGTP